MLPFITQYPPSVSNLKHVLMGKWHLKQNHCEKSSKGHQLFPLKDKNLLMTCLSEQKYRGYATKMFPLLEVVQASHSMLFPTGSTPPLAGSFFHGQQNPSGKNIHNCICTGKRTKVVVVAILRFFYSPFLIDVETFVEIRIDEFESSSFV